MPTITAGMPHQQVVRNMMPNPGTGFGTVTATGTLFAGLKVQRIAINATSTAKAGAAAWINPEIGTVIGWPLLVITTAGNTGTFDMGRTDDGTGSAAGMIDGGTLTAGVHLEGTVAGTVAASATIGLVDRHWYTFGPGGTGTNNSITVTMNDTTTSTLVGYLVVAYFSVT